MRRRNEVTGRETRERGRGGKKKEKVEIKTVTEKKNHMDSRTHGPTNYRSLYSLSPCLKRVARHGTSSNEG